MSLGVLEGSVCVGGRAEVRGAGKAGYSLGCERLGWVRSRGKKLAWVLLGASFAVRHTDLASVHSTLP